MSEEERKELEHYADTLHEWKLEFSKRAEQLGKKYGQQSRTFNEDMQEVFDAEEQRIRRKLADG